MNQHFNLTPKEQYEMFFYVWKWRKHIPYKEQSFAKKFLSNIFNYVNHYKGKKYPAFSVKTIRIIKRWNDNITDYLTKGYMEIKGNEVSTPVMKINRGEWTGCDYGTINQKLIINK